jgi:hypothetical protein
MWNAFAASKALSENKIFGLFVQTLPHRGIM